MFFLIIIMPKSTNRNRKIPKFIKKLYEILQNPQNDQLIGWLPEGSGFQIMNSSRFIEQVLPNYFRHKNMASFVRQLNMYGFFRPKDSSQHVYIHPRFTKGNMNSIRQIHRKPNQSTVIEGDEIMIEEDENSDQNQEEQPSSELNQLCIRLLEQNQKLKKQNQELSLKLNQLTKNKKIIESFPIFACVRPETYFYNNLYGASSIGSEETTMSKNQQSGQKKSKHSFNFWENHSDKGSRLSYQSLIDGARITDGVSTEQKDSL